mmetsp:Transcript_9744/g.21727  ORF Transcript_9744/g.21727 Transcript_9744/m.21727 type:complete len:434 (+) Transcript_9744:306-1607(+)
MYKALASCAIVGLICAGLVIAGILPIFKIEAEIGGDMVTSYISIWCTIGSLVALLLSLTLSHDLLLCLGRQGPDVFLDKVCVDQFNDQKKWEGIHALTSYIWHADELVVVLSEKYLDRIWTVFELISFLILKPCGKISVLPVELATFIIVSACCQSFRILGELVNSYFAPVVHAENRTIVWILGGSLFLLFCSCLIVPMRRWGRVRSQLSKQMETFTFASSSCQHQADREEILSALVALAVDHKIVGEFATTEEVCKVLETRAREVIPQRMHDAISFGGLPARSLLIIFMPLIASELDPIAAELSVGDMDSDQVLLHLLESLLVAFSYPWFLALLGCMTFFPPRKCWFEALILILGGLLMGGYLFAGRVIRNLHHMFQPSAAYLAVVSVLLALEVVFFACIFWPACIERLFSKGTPCSQDASQQNSKKPKSKQ